MNLRAWISTIATVGTTSSLGFAQNSLPTSTSPAAMAAQTSVIHPANTYPVITMRTAGQPDRALRVLKLNEAPDSDTLAEVQDVQTGRVFSMPGKVVMAMLAGTKTPAPAIVSEAPIAALPQAAPAKPAVPAVPVFQPNRIASSIYERPAMSAPIREIPTVTSVQTIVPNPPVSQAPIPRMEAVPEHEKARLLESIGGSPSEAKASEMPTIVEPTMPVIEPVKPPAPEVISIAVLVPTPAPVPAPEVTPIAKLVPVPVPIPVLAPVPEVVPTPARAIAPAPAPVATPAPVPVPAAAVVVTPTPTPAPTPKLAPVPAKPAATPIPQFGSPLQAPQSSSTSLKAVPVQTWQPLRDSKTPGNNSIWQPLLEPTPTPTPVPSPQSTQTKPESTTVTTHCQFEGDTECAEPKVLATVEPQVRVERAAAKCNNFAQLEAQVRESCQSSIYDLCTAAQPVLREEAATKLCTGRFAQRPEVKAALLKAAVGDTAPSVRAHCIECLMKLGHNEAGFRVHLQAASEDGPKIVQAAARTALANLPRE